MDEQARWYAEQLPLAGGVIADVGANVGRLSELFWREAGPDGRVISIEPLRSNARAIERRIAELGATSWSVQACAVSDRDAEIELVARAAPELDTEFAPGAANSVVAGAHAEGTRVRVPCRRLASLVPDATVVKIDIEGHEYVVLDDALGSLAHVQAWALELHLVDGRPLEGTLGRLHACGHDLFAAGRARDDPHGPWRSFAIPPTLSWSAVPTARVHADGSHFKMLHVIARRR